MPGFLRAKHCHRASECLFPQGSHISIEHVGCDNLNRGVAEHRRGRGRAVKSRGSADSGHLPASKSVTWIGLSGIGDQSL